MPSPPIATSYRSRVSSNASRNSGNTRRLSHASRPTHRLSFWAQTPSSYATYMNNTKIRTRETGDYGIENFAYDPDHLDQCEVPQVVMKHPSRKMCDTGLDLLYSQAAVLTSLSRIHALNDDAPSRLDPESTHKHILSSRSSSDDSPTTAGADSLMSSFTTAGTVDSTAPGTPLTPAVSSQKGSVTHHNPCVPVNMVGLDSPPFTPIDSMAVNTPMCEPHVKAAGTIPDLARVTQLCLTINTDSKNESAWEHYLEMMDEEFSDLKDHAVRRLQGYADTIRVLLTEQIMLGKAEKVELKAFNDWYESKAGKYKGLICELEQKVKETSKEVGGPTTHRVFVLPQA